MAELKAWPGPAFASRFPNPGDLMDLYVAATDGSRGTGELPEDVRAVMLAGGVEVVRAGAAGRELLFGDGVKG